MQAIPRHPFRARHHTTRHPCAGRAARTAQPLAIALVSLIALAGCESTSWFDDKPDPRAASAREQTPSDPEVAAIEAQIQAHARLLAGTDREDRRDGPGPDIHWADPTFLKLNPRMAQGPAETTQPTVTVEDTAIPEPTEPEERVVEVEPAPELAPQPPAAPSRSQLLAKLLEDVRTSDDPDMAKAMAMVGLSLADPDRALDRALLQPLSPAQRQQVERYHELVVDLGRKLAQGSDIDLAAFSTRLAELFPRPLEIRTFELCRRVDGYGMYEPFATNAFAAGRPIRLGLYVELDHFGIAEESGYHLVRLSQEITLFKDDLIVWREPVAEVIDRSRNRRRDFFTTQVIQLPANLGVGRYTLKLRVTDHVGGTLDETSRTIRLVADPAMATQDPPTR